MNYRDYLAAGGAAQKTPVTIEAITEFVEQKTRDVRKKAADAALRKAVPAEAALDSPVRNGRGANGPKEGLSTHFAVHPVIKELSVHIHIVNDRAAGTIVSVIEGIGGDRQRLVNYLLRLNVPGKLVEVVANNIIRKKD
jgi:hypothetical protein